MSLIESFTMYAERIDLNFDALFPTTWYEKGLASTMSVWHAMVQILEADNNKPLPFDAILAKLVFGQFCVERMRQEERIGDEDSNYFMMVVAKIQDLLTMMVITPVMRDRFDCMVDLLLKIQKFLDPSHIPSNINAIGSASNIGIKCSFASKLEIIKNTNAVSYL